MEIDYSSLGYHRSIQRASGGVQSGPCKLHHEKQFLHGLGLMVLQWFKSITLLVHFISNLMPLMIWREVGVHGPEAGDPWPRAPAPSICLMLSSVWFFYSVSKCFGPLRNSWQKRGSFTFFLSPLQYTLPCPKDKHTLTLSLALSRSLMGFSPSVNTADKLLTVSL